MKAKNSEDIEIQVKQKDDLVHIKLIPPTSNTTVPTDIICLLDVSGSMDNEATVKNSEGIKESQGYSLLDILKHTVKTTIYNLNEHDRFGLVVFSTQGKIVFPLEEMNNAAKEKANHQLESISSGGVTNLWDGLLQSLEMLRKNSLNSKRQSTIVLLTDGEPNRHPPEGTIQAFINYQQKFQDFNFTLHTLALGKAMDSKILSTLASRGKGQFSFIPCSGFMGTIFVNTFSNILCTFGSNAMLQIKPNMELEIEKIYGYIFKNPSELAIRIGDIKFDQSQDVIIKLKNQKGKFDPEQFFEIRLDYCNILQGKYLTQIKKVFPSKEQQNEEPDYMMNYHYCRLLLVEKVNKVLKLLLKSMSEKNFKIAQEIVKTTAEVIQQKVKEQEALFDEIDLDLQDTHPLKKALQMIQNLYLDISGEITLAFLKQEWFQQWGQHYLPSLLGCHLKQTCNNFKDPGIKNYGGEMFNLIKQQTEDTFMKLPPPKPSLAQEKQKADQKKQQQQQQQQSPLAQKEVQHVPAASFSDYYDAGGGCFAGWSQIQLANGGKKPIKHLIKGDVILTPNGTATIQTILKILCQQPVVIVSINKSLSLTPKHPIFYKNAWTKPSLVQPKQLIQIDYLYNIVVDKEHQVLVGDVWCVTLGHERKEKLAQHPYFGTKKVIEELKRISEWESGIIEVSMKQFKRNAQGQVCSLLIE